MNSQRKTAMEKIQIQVHFCKILPEKAHNNQDQKVQYINNENAGYHINHLDMIVWIICPTRTDQSHPPHEGTHMIT